MNTCEYCGCPADHTPDDFAAEHILPRIRGGTDEAVDPQTGRRAVLYHPRRHSWNDHFRWSEDWLTLIGESPTGRATIAHGLEPQQRRKPAWCFGACEKTSAAGRLTMKQVYPMSKLIFLVEEDPDGGCTARALGQSIFTEADTMDDLRANVREALDCHFEEGQSPGIISRRVA